MSLIKRLGPGLLYAGAAVGVSHIVQSTKAGAIYGWLMILFVLLANVLKFPFFEFGPRYANATGKTMLHGYKKLGSWAVVVFIAATLLTMFIIEAAVCVVTAGLGIQLFGLDTAPENIWMVATVIFAVCIAMIKLGNYSFLDSLMKWIMLTLAICTIAAFAMSFTADVPKTGAKLSFDFSASSMVFLISFVGWMPAPLDISVWHSIWTVTKNKGQYGRQILKNGKFDFAVGYWGTMILAVLFVGLGAMMLYGSGIKLESGAGAFAGQLISIYTDSLGDWSYYVIAIAAFTTMFSTTLSCLDAFGRVMQPSIEALKNKSDDENIASSGSLFWLSATAIGAIIILKYFMKDMGELVQFITILSFVAAPIIAFLNYRVIYNVLDEEFRPHPGIKYLAWTGLSLMTGLSVYYVTTIV